MYLPEAFRETDPKRIGAIIRDYPFATLITSDHGTPLVSHLPLLCEFENESPTKMIGHMARANPQWQAFEKCADVLVMFQGPHAYVSPSWYSSPGVPTWNYATVHLQGKARVTRTHAELDELLHRLTTEHESGKPTPWRPLLEPQQREKLFDLIVGFEIDVTDIQARFKLSQNRSQEDQQQVMAKLGQSEDQTERAVSALMQEIYRTK